MDTSSTTSLFGRWHSTSDDDDSYSFVDSPDGEYEVIKFSPEVHAMHLDCFNDSSFNEWHTIDGWKYKSSPKPTDMNIMFPQEQVLEDYRQDKMSIQTVPIYFPVKCHEINIKIVGIMNYTPNKRSINPQSNCSTEDTPEKEVAVVKKVWIGFYLYGSRRECIFNPASSTFASGYLNQTNGGMRDDGLFVVARTPPPLRHMY
jgi:hypothetical protein